ncbi:unnamed protein product [Caenorhabditis auriculariae]|uniref:IBR domain-containing protein n=1 Tax=Caenorhabditis auriculariae TaxID=2777116 RepID=A0A8S1HPE2_9PELO|nr:unnamed protein product [Caenorhabditis auriculariae]
MDDNEFPELGKGVGRKEKGRRNAAADRHARHMADAGVVVKSIDDPNHVLGKRRKARLLSEGTDGMVGHVPYSINRNNRWNEICPSVILNGSDESEVPVAVVECAITSKGTSSNVAALHEANDDGDVDTITAGGKGTNLNTLRAGVGKRTRGAKARKEARIAKMMQELGDPEVEAEKEEAEEQGPRVQYTIYKPHQNHRVLAGKLFSRKYNIRNAGRARVQKKFDLEDVEGCDLETSVHVEDDVYKPSRDMKFCLGDYITGKSKSTVFVRRQSIESQPSDQTDQLEDTPKPFDLLDISEYVRAPQTFNWYEINTAKWTDFNFALEFKDLEEDENLDVIWVDLEGRQVIVDASAALSEEEKKFGELSLMLVFERSLVKPSITKLLVNSSIEIDDRHKAGERFAASLTAAKSFKEVVAVATTAFAEWRLSDHRSQRSLRNADKKVLTNYTAYLLAENSQFMAKTAKTLTTKRQMSLIKNNECVLADESFERIETDSCEYPSDDEEDADAVVPQMVNMKCDRCSKASIDDLFELDDCWRCRSCLNTEIVHKIRAGVFPLDIPFMVNSSEFDSLPAIIPLPLLKFYIKSTACELIANSDDEIGDIHDCPSCRHMCLVPRPNEFNTCSCSSCGIHWCTSCLGAPHWPMPCDQFPAWSKILFDDVCGYRSMKREFSDACAEAYNTRCTLLKSLAFDKNVRRNLKTLKVSSVEKVRELRKTVTLIVQNGLGFVYMSKKCDELGDIKQSLMQLSDMWREAESSLKRVDETFGAQIEKIEKALAAAFVTIKKHI